MGFHALGQSSRKDANPPLRQIFSILPSECYYAIWNKDASTADKRAGPVGWAGCITQRRTPLARQTHMQNSTILVGKHAALSLLTPQCSELVSGMLYHILYAGPSGISRHRCLPGHIVVKKI